MPKFLPAAVPQLRHHKPSGRAYVRLDNRMVYLGTWGTPQSHTAYAKAIGEWIARGRKPAVVKAALTVTELIDRYWAWAESYYVGADGQRTGECGIIFYALRAWRSLHGSMSVAEYGPSHLRTLQEHMVKPLDPSRARIEKEAAPWHPEYGLGWSRTNANAQIRRIVRCLRWGVERELVEGAVYLGHADADTTLIYAEADRDKLIQIAAAVG